MSEAVRYYTRNRKENSSEDSGVESGNSLENNGEQSNELSNWNWDEEIIQIYPTDTQGFSVLHTTQYRVQCLWDYHNNTWLPMSFGLSVGY